MIKQTNETVKSLYIHIPFCVKKCPYCDFTAFQGALHEEERYIESLIREIKLYGEREYETVYIGGGTPTLLSNLSLIKIFSALRIQSEAEITIETNPEITKEKIFFLKSLGINRISIGVQSFQSKLLNVLGRMHNKNDVRRAISWCREAGIFNINLDLIYAIPTQTLEDVDRDLQEVIDLNPDHISYYSLIWEEGTKFYFDLEKNKIKEIDEELEEKWYFNIDRILEQHGYFHYEISNFAKKGYESKHNEVYWKNDKYIGVGLGASGYCNNIRYTNYKGFYLYYNSLKTHDFPILEKEYIKKLANQQNQIMLGLRLLKEGCKIPLEYENKVQELCFEGKLEKIGSNYRIKRDYWYLSNQIIRKIIFE